MSIQVLVTAGVTEAQSTVQATGSVQAVITPAQAAQFGLTDGDLKSAVAAYFGKAPDDAYLCSPTPWNDLYRTYGWPQVQVTLVPVSATVLGLKITDSLVKNVEFNNPSSEPATFSAVIQDSKTDTASSAVSSTDSVTVGQKITYKIGFLGTDVGGETSLSYTHDWGKQDTESLAVTLGSSTSVSVLLQPGQHKKAVLSATLGALSVSIGYRAYLTGMTAINYGDTYQGHHFWALDINSVLEAAKKPTSFDYTETMDISYYSSSVVTLEDDTASGEAGALLFSSAARPGLAGD
ncbi:follicular epithelium yolk protein subunit [Clavibacter sp. VKM Ac-2873]|uniref:follicular epithelium yolk protein subunit n=1 Tax=Clavibacter sp. VKM Ac-2873 TaxID=2783813 RepID=UPI00188BAAEF|nr:follicular epithelium yolk protein subunit [Clavibacter sp. VKM Ac-2873]MBF4617712.1 follicular epithelium yolk protein subunit [Clavibacter sp. VKM Ac-2873]